MNDAQPVAQTVDLVGREVAFQGYFRVARYRLRHTLHAGGMGAVLSREVFERGHAAAVLPYDPALDRVVLIRQFRAGAFAAGRPPWIWETVAGMMEPGETAEQVARREAREEAGLAIGELWPIHSYFVSPGGASETCTSFVGRCDAARAGGVHGLPEEGEDILVRAFDWAEARAMLDRGELASATGTIALQWLALHRDEVRAKWR